MITGRLWLAAIFALAATSCGGPASPPSSSDGVTEVGGEVEEPEPDRPRSPRSEPDPPVSTVSEQFEVTVTTDRTHYGPGQRIEFTIEVCNRGGPVTSEGGGGSTIPHSFVVRHENGDVVPDDTHAVHTADLVLVPWEPDQCRRERDAWDGEFWNRPRDVATQTPEVYGTPIRGGAVPAGDYVIEVTVLGGPARSTPFTLTR